MSISSSDSVRGTPLTSATVLHPERRLERRVLEELVERDLRDRVALQLDLDAHARAVRVILEVGDLREHLVVDEIGDLRDHAGLAALLHAVRQLGDDDRALAAAQLLDVRPCAHHDAAAAGAVRVADARPSDDDRAGREVGALDVLHQVLDIRVGLVDQRDDRADHLGEVVRRDVRRHPDGDAGAAVDEQVREPGRQDERLALRLVVVRAEVDGVGVRARAASPRRASRGAPPCSASRPADRRRSSRSCPGRRRADTAARTAAPCGRACRRSTRRRAGDGCPSRSRRCSRSSRTAGPGRLPFDHIEKRTRR